MTRFLLLTLICVGLFVSVLQAQSPQAQVAYRKGIAYLNKGKNEKGLGQLDKALQLDSSYREAWYAKGYYAFDHGDYRQALGAFDHLIQLYPRDTTFYRYRALTHLYLDAYDLAERDLQVALSIDSTNPDTYNDLGYLYYQWGQPEQALQQFDKSLRWKTNKTAHYYQALVYYDEDKPSQALATVEKALKLEPNYPQALRLKANLLADTKKYAEAIKLYERLAETGDLAEPGDLLDWGLIYYRMKQYPQSLVYFTIPENHQSATLHYYTGLARYRTQKPVEALQSLNKAVALADTTDEAYASLFYDRAVMRHAANDRKGAVADLLRAVYLMPEILKRQNAKGDTLDLLGNAAQLLKNNYTQAQLDKASAAGYRDRAESLLEAENGEQDALRYANEAVRLDETSGEGFFIRGRILYLTNDYNKALKDFDRGFQLMGDRVDGYHYYIRGLAYFELEQYEQAHDDFSRAIQLNARESAYYYDRSYAAAALGEYKEAVNDINEAMALEEDKMPLLLVRAGFYNEMKLFKEALADCDVVLASDATNALAYCLRGYANEGLRQKPQAIADYAKALQLDPALDDARMALEELAGLRR